jgi:hypothetical protein
MLNAQSAVLTLTKAIGIRQWKTESELNILLENTCMQEPSPRLTDKTLRFLNMKNWEKLSCGNTIILRIVLKLKNPPKISLLITKLSISQTYISWVCYYTYYKLQFNVKFNHKRFAKRFKMFLKLNDLLSNYR